MSQLSLFNKQTTSWFWCSNPPALFIGRSGREYPSAQEIEHCGYPVSKEQVFEVFMRQVNPYAAYLIPAGQITTLYFKQIFEPPI